MNPEDARWRLSYGSALSQNNKRMEADAQYREALRIEPDNPAALNGLGYSMVESGEKVDEARAMIQRAVDAQPTNSSYLDSLAWAYFKLGKLQDAEKYGSQAAKDSKSPVVLEHLGDIYDKLGKKDQAAAAWQKALALAVLPEQKTRLKTKLGVEQK